MTQGPDEPIDDAYEALFRPEQPRPQADAEPDVGPDVGPETEREDQPEDELADVSAAERAPAPATPGADTGRLFRSQGADGHPTAVLALASDHGGRLRTLARDTAASEPRDLVASATGMSPDARDLLAEPEGPDVTGRRQRSAHRSAGISAGAVYLIVIGLTVAVGFLNAWLGGGELGWPTGIALLASSAYCAARARRSDDVVAMIVPPLAFFLAAVTAGQLLRGASAGGLLNRAQLVFFTLAYNWYWVIGATVVAVVIVLARRRRT